MKIFLSGRRLGLILGAACILLAVFWVGCGKTEESSEKIRDLEFSVVGENEIPQELKEMIEEKKQKPFRLTYTGGTELYIAEGYGRQETGGYSITVPELYLTENAVIIKTELKGPEDAGQAGTDPSFPFIVLKTELVENPVVFR